MRMPHLLFGRHNSKRRPVGTKQEPASDADKAAVRHVLDLPPSNVGVWPDCGYLNPNLSVLIEDISGELLVTQKWTDTFNVFLN